MMKKKFITTKNIFIYFLTLFFSGCVNNKIGNSMSDLYVLPTTCDFMTVGNNGQQSSDCSPKLTDEYSSKFRGLLINGAAEIIWPKNFSLEDIVVMPNGNAEGPLKFMIAGLIKLPYSTLDLQGNFSGRALVVAVNQKTAETYSGRMVPFGFKGVKPNVPGFAESQKNIDAIRYFNIDLVQNLNIPIEGATYTVYATLGDFKSNVLTIKTIIK
jgi:hypothetical protein